MPRPGRLGRRVPVAGRHGGERQEAAYAASGMGLDPGELELWIEARALQVAVWRAFSVRRAGHQLAVGSSGTAGATSK